MNWLSHLLGSTVMTSAIMLLAGLGCFLLLWRGYTSKKTNDPALILWQGWAGHLTVYYAVVLFIRILGITSGDPVWSPIFITWGIALRLHVLINVVSMYRWGWRHHG